jgi:hypothetical protein
MAQQTIGVGTAANDGTGDPLRTAFQKCNDNFTELYGGEAGAVAKTGDTMSGPLHVPDDAYDATTWNGSDQVPTKNAVRDKIEAIVAGGTYTDEQAQDAAAAMIAAGTNTGLTVTYNDAGNAESIAVDTVAEAERIRDVIGAALVAGTNVTITVNDAGDTITIAASGGGGAGNAWNLQRGPLDNEAPSSNFAMLDSRNGHPVLSFNDTTAQSAVFTLVMPNDYSGAGITVTLYWAGATATSGNVMWQATLEAVAAGSQDTDSDGFATAQAFAAAAANASSGVLTKSSLSVSNGANMDSIAAGDLFRLKITRDASNASDTMTGDAQLMRVMMVSQ